MSAWASWCRIVAAQANKRSWWLRHTSLTPHPWPIIQTPWDVIQDALPA